MTLLAQALAEPALYAAWQKVEANGGMAGVDGVTIESYSAKLFGRLITLKKDLEQGRYVPMPLLEFPIPKDNGKIRYLAVPTVRDRVIQTAVARVLGPKLDAQFEDPSYGYRPGRSVQQAIARVADYRDQGYQWVVDADITTFFDNIDHDILMAKLAQAVPDDDSLWPLIRMWLAAVVQPAMAEQSRLLTKGVPQGSPLSPLLANLYLDGFDEAIIDASLRLVRFADDFLILCRQREDAEDALELTETVLQQLKLKLNPEKTQITHFEQGIQFLGVRFIKDLMTAEDPDAAPWLIPKAPDDVPASLPQTTQQQPEQQSSHVSRLEEEPEWQDEADAWRHHTENTIEDTLQRTLYIHEQGLKLLKEGERLVVARKREMVTSIPLYRLDHIVIHGNALISTALLRFSQQERIAIHFNHLNGSPAAQLGHAKGSVVLQQEQHIKLADPQWKMHFARAHVSAKIANMRAVIRRYNRRREDPALWQLEHAMAQMAEKAKYSKELEVLRGTEGMATRYYFQAFKLLLPEAWQFEGRNRQPPADAINCLLSYGYGVLYNSINAFLTRRGLSPWIGTLHAIKHGHAALASDMMEEYRAPVIDVIVLQWAMQNGNQPETLFHDPNANRLVLTPEARKAFIEQFEARLRATAKHPKLKRSHNYQYLMHWQINHYAKVLLGQDETYTPFYIK